MTGKSILKGTVRSVGEEQSASKFTMGDLKKLIADSIAEALPKATEPVVAKPTGEASTKSVGIAEAVKAEIDKLKAKETEESEKQTIQQKLQELSEKTAEKEPVERRRVHKLMGWGENG
jgi:hypothetical protein